jgi:hypothetical protein
MLEGLCRMESFHVCSFRISYPKIPEPCRTGFPLKELLLTGNIQKSNYLEALVIRSIPR